MGTVEQLQIQMLNRNAPPQSTGESPTLLRIVRSDMQNLDIPIAVVLTLRIKSLFGKYSPSHRVHFLSASDIKVSIWPGSFEFCCFLSKKFRRFIFILVVENSTWSLWNWSQRTNKTFLAVFSIDVLGIPIPVPNRRYTDTEKSVWDVYRYRYWNQASIPDTGTELSVYRPICESVYRYRKVSMRCVPIPILKSSQHTRYRYRIVGIPTHLWIGIPIPIPKSQYEMCTDTDTEIKTAYPIPVPNCRYTDPFLNRYTDTDTDTEIKPAYRYRLSHFRTDTSIVFSSRKITPILRSTDRTGFVTFSFESYVNTSFRVAHNSTRGMFVIVICLLRSMPMEWAQQHLSVMAMLRFIVVKKALKFAFLIVFENFVGSGSGLGLSFHKGRDRDWDP